ncbi:MAG: elongation factor G [Bacilli bacterium]
MKEYHSKNIRNVAVLGHLGCGKTSFIESVLYATGAIEKKGSVDKKNTVCDYTVEEQERQTTFISTLASVEWKDKKINFIDTPGSEEFVGDVSDILSVVGAAILLIDASKGVEVGTERCFEQLKARKIPTFVFVNKMDKENVKYDKLVADLKEAFEEKVFPFSYPIMDQGELVGLKLAVERQIIKNDVLIPMEDDDPKVNELYQDIAEAVAETDEKLLEKYFDKGLTVEEVKNGIEGAIKVCGVYPLTCGSALEDKAIKSLLNMISDYLPAAEEADGKRVEGSNKRFRVDEDTPFSAYVFKTIIDPFVGTINYFKIYGGSVKTGSEVYISNIDKTVKMPQIFSLNGKKQIPLDEAFAGDMIAVAKLTELQTGYTMCEKKNTFKFIQPVYPSPIIYIAISPKNKQDDEKISSALQKMALEDATFEVKRNVETAQLLIGGQGTTHINYIITKMKNSFNVEVDTEKPKIVYREAIRSNTSSLGEKGAHGRHKKQSGGAGQFGDVYIRFEPSKEDFEFESVVVGGNVPKGYFPAVEKGLKKALEKGPLAGFPVIGVKATLTDGSYHPVDSNEVSFVLAAKLAWQEACKVVKPTILEPIYQVNVIIKDVYVGAVMGDMSKRRGRIIDQKQVSGGKTEIIVEVPEAEIVAYATELKALTQANGAFSRIFLRYDVVPEDKIKNIIEENKVN